MLIGILVNVMNSDASGATTYRLAADCLNRGHDVWVLSAGNFSYNPDDSIGALARTVPPGRYTSAEFLETLNSGKAIEREIRVDELDVLLLRSNPPAQRPWAQSAGVHFGRLAMRRGVIVLNDPNGLSKAMNKLYLQTFPEAVRPRTLVTRSLAQIVDFVEREGKVIVKPLQGSGGQGVFLLRSGDIDNVEGIVKSVSRDGYVIVQEYLEAAAEGDTRLFLMNGVPLQWEGKYAAFRRIRSGGDVRSNVHAGGKLRRATVDAAMLQVAEQVRPRLVQDGMFLVGLDVVGDKLLEINVFTPGGLGSAELFEKVSFTDAVIQSLEHKVRLVKDHPADFDNIVIATQ